jgi:hypothetical protein
MQAYSVRPDENRLRCFFTLLFNQKERVSLVTEKSGAVGRLSRNKSYDRMG